MKTIKLLFTFLFLLFTFLSFPQWNWQNPYPQGNNLNDVQFSDSLTGWAVGDNGTIVKTTNGGLTWDILTSGTTENLIKISVIDINTLWVVSTAGLILNSYDGGVYWTQLPVGIADYLVDGLFVEDGKGWIIGKEDDAFTVFHTSDWGVSWDTQIDDTTFNLKSIYFLNNTIGWVVGTKHSSNSLLLTEGILLRTINGGDTWELQSFPNIGFNDITFIDPENGWALGLIFGEAQAVLKTDDGGYSWTSQYWYEYGYFKKVFFTDSNNGWVIGGADFDGSGPQPFTMSTIDGGETWGEMQWLGSDYSYSFLYGIFFSDNNNGWVVGRSGIIRHTNDGGNTWESQSGVYTFIPLNDIFFTNESNGWAVGYHLYLPSKEIILKTNDGGNTWINQSQNLSFYPSSIWFNDTLIGWATGRGGYPLKGRIYQTIDGGNTWTMQFDLLYNTLYDICFTDQNNGWAVGSGGYVIHPNILHTSNAGNTWEPQDAGTDIGLEGVCFVNQNNGWAVGWEGTILYTSNGGINWVPQISGTTLDLKDVVFIDSNNGWAVGGYYSYSLGSEAIILHTSNGGSAWETQLADTNFHLTSLSFTNTENGWSVGPNGLVYTNNGGINWEQQYTAMNRYGSSVYFTDPNHGWIAGERGTILHTDNGGITEILETKIPNSKIQLKNYPNPFNSSTTIEFSLAETGLTSLSLYDISGKLHEKIISEELTSGKYTFELNAEGLPPGIYFLRLETNKISETRKLILLN